ncbi:MAG: hypothetical protein NC248_00305 [Bacteroides sp.]|nr:hypothetical protein [Lachnospiraceae bacterium]MCM1331032.1 hypothetical protein [Bacteroides sp.]MCM1389181.1 hypothetical protein [Bacteroides sp.]
MKILRVILSIALLAYIVVAVSWSRNQSATELCRGIVVDPIESRFVTTKEITRELGQLPEQSVKMRIHQINTDSIERMLASIDNIERVRCIVMTDNRIHVEVDPLEPVARIFDRDSSYYINRAGKRISATARYHSDVPIVSGAFTKEFPPTEVLPLVSFINNDSTWSTLITHIKAYDRRNVILVPMIHGHVINIGDIENLDDKFDRLRLAYKKILPVKGWDFYDTLSVKWRGQVVATRRVKRLHQAISTVDIEAEQELPDIGTMMVDENN